MCRMTAGRGPFARALWIACVSVCCGAHAFGATVRHCSAGCRERLMRAARVARRLPAFIRRPVHGAGSLIHSSPAVPRVTLEATVRTVLPVIGVQPVRVVLANETPGVLHGVLAEALGPRQLRRRCRAHFASRRFFAATTELYVCPGLANPSASIISL